MSDFLLLCSSFISGCAEFFDISVPGLGNITFFELFTALFIIKASLVGVKICFGIDHDKDGI